MRTNKAAASPTNMRRARMGDRESAETNCSLVAQLVDQKIKGKQIGMRLKRVSG